MCSLIGRVVGLEFSTRLFVVAFLLYTHCLGCSSWRCSLLAVEVCYLRREQLGSNNHISCQAAGHNIHSSMCYCSAGTPLEVQKRKAVVPLLYIMSFLWLAQVVFAGKHSALMYLMQAALLHIYCG